MVGGWGWGGKPQKQGEELGWEKNKQVVTVYTDFMY